MSRPSKRFRRSVALLIPFVGVLSAGSLNGCTLIVDTMGLRTDSTGDGADGPDGADGGGSNATPDGATPSTDAAGDGGEGGNAGDGDAGDAGDGSIDDGGPGGDGSDGGSIPVLAKDTFSRTVNGGFGTADVGGLWQLTGTSSAFTVSSGVGHLSLPGGAGGTARTAELPISVNDADIAVAIATDKIPSGGTLYSSILGRSVGASGDYRCRTVVDISGSAHASMARFDGTETKLFDSANLFSVPAGGVMRVRCQVTGTSPTHLRMKLWLASGTEPASWNIDITDSTASLQAKGGVGFYVYVDTISNGPLDVTVDDLLVRPASLLP